MTYLCIQQLYIFAMQTLNVKAVAKVIASLPLFYRSYHIIWEFSTAAYWHHRHAE